MGDSNRFCWMKLTTYTCEAPPWYVPYEYQRLWHYIRPFNVLFYGNIVWTFQLPCKIYSGWWVGTFFYFPIIYGNHHPNWLSYFSRLSKPPTSWNIFSWGNFLWTALNLDQGSQVFLLFSQSWALCWWLQGGGFSGVAWHRQRHPGMGLHLALKTKCDPRSSSKYFISWKLVNWVNKLS